MAQISKAQLKEHMRQIADEKDLLFLALNDVLDEKVKWFKKKGLKMGVSRVDAASGPILIVYAPCYASAYSWDKYWDMEKNISVPQGNEDWQNRRNLLIEIDEWVNKEKRRICDNIAFGT